MKKTSILIGSLMLVLLGLTSTGCRTSLSIPFVDLSMGTQEHKHSHGSRDRHLEHRIHELEEQNEELRERLDGLEETPD